MKKTAIFCYTSISIIIALVLFVCVVVSYDDLDDVLQKAHEQHPEIPVVYDKVNFGELIKFCSLIISFLFLQINHIANGVFVHIVHVRCSNCFFTHRFAWCIG